MTISEFHQAVMAALAVEPNKDILQDLSGEAQALADMTGWADDTIDKDDHVFDALTDLQSRAKRYFDACKLEDVAVLHDAIGNLIVAIIRHDEDLTPSTDGDEDSGVI